MITRLYLISPPAKWQSWLKSLIMLGLIVSVASVYRSYIWPSPHTHYYQLLGEAFLSGHTYITPYKLLDVERYMGKYYLYFGPVPALLIWIPVKLVTGVGIGDTTMNWVMATMGTCCLLALMYLMSLRRSSTSMPGLFLCLMAIGFSKWTVPAVFGDVYEAAIATAYAFTAMGMLCLWLYLNHKEKKLWIALAGLCFGLAMGSRITYAFTAVILLLAFFFIWRKEKCSYHELAVNAIYTFTPFLVCLIALGIYNYERFGVVWDNGIRHMLGPFPYSSPNFHLFRLDFHLILLHAYYYLLSPPWHPHPPTCCNDPGIPFGIWLNNPFSWLFLFFLLDWRSLKSWKPETVVIIGSMAIIALLQFALLCAFFAASSRYEADFAPWMIFTACAYYLHLLQQYQGTRYYPLFIALGGILVACGILRGAALRFFIP